MNKAQPFNIVIAACALAVGLLGLGFILKSAALDVKGMELRQSHLVSRSFLLLIAL